MATTAIVCIARNESPFLEEWAEYHFRLGFDRIYCISTDDDLTKAKGAVGRCAFSSRIELGHWTDFEPGWQMACYNAQLPLVEEDWLMVIDVDEFVYLRRFESIHEYLDTIGGEIGQIQLPWLLHLSATYSQDRVLTIAHDSRGRVSDHVKSIVRRASVDGLGIHDHGVRRLETCLSSGAQVPIRPRHGSLLTDPEYADRHPVVLHFASRGHLDMMNRIMDHRFFDGKSGKAERQRLARFLLEPADWSNIPTRCLLMQFYRALPRIENAVPVPRLDSRTDVDDLREIFRAHIRSLIGFDCPDLAEIEERFERRSQLAVKLTKLDATSMVRLDEYLECGTQVDYTHRLRASLVNP